MVPGEDNSVRHVTSPSCGQCSSLPGCLLPGRRGVGEHSATRPAGGVLSDGFIWVIGVAAWRVGGPSFVNLAADEPLSELFGDRASCQSPVSKRLAGRRVGTALDPGHRACGTSPAGRRDGRKQPVT